MSIEEMREKISEEVNKLDDEKVLHQVLQILNEKSGKTKDEIDATKHIDALFQKHDGLLKRLA